MWALLKAHPIRTFALICVAATSIFLAYMAERLIGALSSPGWCNRALKADEIATDSTFDPLKACVGLLTIQLKALAINSHIVLGVFAMCLLVLIVIVIAGGKLSLAASKTGLSANMGREDVDEAVANAVDQTAQAAETKAEEIKTDAKSETKFTPPPGEQL